MNERNSIQELLNQLANSEHWVKRIAAAYLGVRPYHGEGGQRRLREEIISLRNSAADD